MKINSLKGTNDIFGSQIETQAAVEKLAQWVFESYAFRQIRTPIIEQSDLFKKSIGQSTDIVKKEMFTFSDRGQRSIALRPEQTASVVRAYIENKLYKKLSLAKFYYTGPMFRAERPQKGRMRQFYQMGVEAIGSYDPYLDAEIIQLMDQIVTELGLRDYEIVINSLGCGKNKNKYRKALKKYLKPYLNELCKDCQNRYKTNPLRILDCKNSKCQKIINKAPYPLDYLCDECRAHFAKVKKLLTSVGVKYTVNPRLVRGLDYYTRTTFELVHKKLGAKNTICAGGRYDTLVSDFGGPDKGACGFAFGIERLILATKEEGLEIKPEKEISVYLAVIGEEAKEQAFILTNKLRKKSILTYIDYQGKSLKAQMRQANKLNCKYVLVIGEDELKKSKFILKNMRKHSQEEINKEKIVSYLVKDIGLHKNSSDLDYRD